MSTHHPVGVAPEPASADDSAKTAGHVAGYDLAERFIISGGMAQISIAEAFGNLFSFNVMSRPWPFLQGVREGIDSYLSKGPALLDGR